MSHRSSLYKTLRCRVSPPLPFIRSDRAIAQDLAHHGLQYFDDRGKEIKPYCNAGKNCRFILFRHLSRRVLAFVDFDPSSFPSCWLAFYTPEILDGRILLADKTIALRIVIRAIASGRMTIRLARPAIVVVYRRLLLRVNCL